MKYYAEFILTGDTKNFSFDGDYRYLSDSLRLVKDLGNAKYYKSLSAAKAAATRKAKQMDNNIKIEINIIEVDI